MTMSGASWYRKPSELCQAPSQAFCTRGGEAQNDLDGGCGSRRDETDEDGLPAAGSSGEKFGLEIGLHK